MFAVQADFHIQLPAGVAGHRQLAALHFAAHCAVGQERQAVAFQHHAFQAFGHIGFVAGGEVEDFFAIGHHQRHHALQVGAGGVGQKRDGVLRAAGQAEGRLAAGGAAGVGAQGFFAQGQHVVARRVEQHRLVRVVVAQQHVAAAAFQRHHRIVHIAGGQPGAEFAAAALDLGQPLGKEGQRQIMRHGDVQRVWRGGLLAAQQGAGVVELGDDFQRLAMKQLAGRGQPGGVGGAVDQVHAQPAFQRADAAGERRLGDMAQLGRAGKTMGFGQTDEVFQPFQIHRGSLWSTREAQRHAA